ncbi:MAG: radical SAM protein [Candidatus ainarchaeum sp.]|nr:radical SAM protein [Candidatus ainarchaeum sp.]MDD3975731.1 radical SAM protein [Candidatus ainarchaeum sp.]
MIYILNPFVKLIKLDDKYTVLYNPFSQEIYILLTKLLKIYKKGVLSSSIDIDVDLIELDFLVDQNTNFLDYFYKKSKIILSQKDYGIHVMYLLLHSKCNLNCKYCFVKDYFDNISIKKEHIIKALKLYKNQKSKLKKKIILYGGEPLLDYNLVKFTLEKIYSIFKKNANIIIVTNGVKLDLKYVNLFKKYNVSVGISIDGFSSKTNSNRVNHNNKNMYLEIKKGFDLLISKKIPVSVSYTLTKDNIRDIKHFVKNLDTKMSFSFNLLHKQKMVFDDKFIDDLFDVINILTKKNILEDRIYYRRFLAIVFKRFYVKDCAGMGNQLVVLPSGKIGICHGYDWKHKTYFEKNLNDISLKYDFTKDYIWDTWNKRSTFNILNCWNCIGLTLCGGGCIVNKTKGKDLNIYQLDLDNCKLYKKIIRKLILKIAKENLKKKI